MGVRVASESAMVGRGAGLAVSTRFDGFLPSMWRSIVLVAAILLLVIQGDPAFADQSYLTPTLAKSFSGSAEAGGTVVLTFTIVNSEPSSSFSDIAFTDDLDAVIPGLVAIGLPQLGVCGGTSSLSGTSTISFTGGLLTASSSCSFDVTLQVPSNVGAGSYSNATGNLTGSLNFYEADIDTSGATASLTIVGSPEINVTGNGKNIADGDTSPRSADDTDFGSTQVSGGTITKTFTVENIGTATLTLGSNAASLSGANADDFTVTKQPATTLAPSASTTVTIRFNPSATGLRTAMLTIANDDADESPYNFAIQGTGTNTVTAGLTIVLKIGGENRAVAFTSATSDLNFTMTSSGGEAQKSFSGLSAGTYRVQSEDLGAVGYELNDVSCDDGDSTGSTANRRAIVRLASAESVTCTFVYGRISTRTPQTISSFLQDRAGILLKHLPDIGRRLDRILRHQSAGSVSISAYNAVAQFQLPVPLSVQITDHVFGYAASTRALPGIVQDSVPAAQRWDIWSEGYGAWFETGTGRYGSGGVLHNGVDYLLTDDALVGVRVDVDWTNDFVASTGAVVSGLGWMAGPYGLIRLNDNLYADFSATWGTSINEISPLGTYTDTFTTQRWLLYGALVGEFDAGDYVIRPQFQGKLFNEDQNAYVDSLGRTIAARSVSQGEISFAPRISKPQVLGDGTLFIPWAEPTIGYIFSGKGVFSGPSIATSSTFHGSLEVGVDLGLPGGAYLMGSGQYDYLSPGTSVYGASVGISAKLP